MSDIRRILQRRKGLSSGFDPPDLQADRLPRRIGRIQRIQLAPRCTDTTMMSRNASICMAL